jgi:hypothetical protein
MSHEVLMRSAAHAQEDVAAAAVDGLQPVIDASAKNLAFEKVGYRITIARSATELEELSAGWNELLGESAAASVFLTWEWMVAWLAAVRPAAKLLVIAVRDGQGQLVGLAPFYRASMRLARVVPYRCLRLVGDEDTGAEYPDLIIRRGRECRTWRAGRAHLNAGGGSAERSS